MALMPASKAVCLSIRRALPARLVITIRSRRRRWGSGWRARRPPRSYSLHCRDIFHIYL